jgi:hypothetical protein
MTDQILDEPDIRALIARAVADEPAYDMAPGAALDAAVAAGRRRRVRGQASRGLALVAVAATVAGGVALVRVPSAPTGPNLVAGSGSVIGLVDATPSIVPPVSGATQLPSPIPSSPNGTPLPTASPSSTLAVTPTVSPTPTSGTSGSVEPTPTPAGDPLLLARLEAFVRSLAATARGTIVTMNHDQFPAMLGTREYLQTDVNAHVTTPAGAFDVGASANHLDAFDVTTWRSNCSPSTGDLKPCTVIGTSAYDVMASYDMGANPGQAGRATFQYVAAAPDGSTLDVNFDNYTEQPGHLKNVGPSWKAAGLDYAALRAAAKANTLLR